MKTADLPIFDAADYLTTDEHCAHYLIAASEEVAGEVGDLDRAISDIVRARARHGLAPLPVRDGNTVPTLADAARALGLAVRLEGPAAPEDEAA